MNINEIRKYLSVLYWINLIAIFGCTGFIVHDVLIAAEEGIFKNPYFVFLTIGIMIINYIVLVTVEELQDMSDYELERAFNDED